MKTAKLKKPPTILLLLALGLITMSLHGQNRYSQSNSASITVAGTSTIHNWRMISKNVTSSADFETNASGEVVKLNSLQVILDAESLKSGKSGMDKNAYSALMTDKYKQITFQIVFAKIEAGVIQCQGKLKIAGVIKDVSLKTTYTMQPGGMLQAKGSTTLLMSDYGIEPPTFMFGSVTTGDEITISFDVTLAPVKNNATTFN